MLLIFFLYEYFTFKLSSLKRLDIVIYTYMTICIWIYIFICECIFVRICLLCNMWRGLGEEGWKGLRCWGISVEDTGRRGTRNERRTTDSPPIPPEANVLDLGGLLHRTTFVLFLSVYIFLCDFNLENASKELKHPELLKYLCTLSYTLSQILVTNASGIMKLNRIINSTMGLLT